MPVTYRTTIGRGGEWSAPGDEYDPSLIRYGEIDPKTGRMVYRLVSQPDPSVTAIKPAVRPYSPAMAPSLKNAGSYSPPMAPPTPAGGEGQVTPTSGGGLSVRMPDGSVRNFGTQPWKDPALDAALKAGAIPIDPIDHSDMIVTPGVYGGYLFSGLPINTIMGADWAPGQKEALTNYYAAGWQPGTPALPNPPALPPSARVNYPGGQGAGSPFDFGYLAQPFTDQFAAPSGAPGAFEPPTAESIGADPGVQYRLEQAQKALSRRASAGAYLGTPREALELNRNVQGEAAQEYNAAYGRRLTTHEQAMRDYQSQWDRAMAEFQQRYNIDTGNKTNIFNRFSTLSGGGQVAANQLAGQGIRFGESAGANLSDAAIAAANARLAAAAARRQAAGNIDYSLTGLSA